MIKNIVYFIMGFLLAIALIFHNYNYFKVEGGYLFPDNWLVVKIKTPFPTNLFINRFIKVRIDDVFVEKEYKELQKED